MSWAEAAYILNNMGAGIPPADMETFYVSPGESVANLYFDLPRDTVTSNTAGLDFKVCTVAGVRILMKEGDEDIIDENDGIVIGNFTERGKYIDEPYVVTGLTNGKQYTFKAFPYSDRNMFNRSELNQKKLIPTDHILLGFKIEKNNSDPDTRVKYTEQAVGLTPATHDVKSGKINLNAFKGFWFIKENKPYMVKYSGEADYELNEENYGEKKDLTISDIEDINYEGNAMVKMPLVWLKQWEDDEYEYCNISDTQIDSSYKAYAHTRADGSVAPYIWISLFNGTFQEKNTSTTLSARVLTTNYSANEFKLRSMKMLRSNEVTYQLINNDTKTADMVSATTRNGDNWYPYAWIHRNLLRMLTTLLFKTDNIEGAVEGIGENYANDTLYGQFFCKDDAGRLFHLANLTSCHGEAVAGITLTYDGEYKVSIKPPYTDYVTAKSNVKSETRPDFIRDTYMSPYGRFPITLAGSKTTYACDEAYMRHGYDDKLKIAGQRCISAEGDYTGSTHVHGKGYGYNGMNSLQLGAWFNLSTTLKMVCIPK